MANGNQGTTGKRLISQRRLDRIKNKANRAGIPFNLTVQDIEIPEECPVLGLPLELPGCSDAVPTVDRIIPSLGYVKGNVMVISDLANRIKSNATPDQIRKVADFYSNLIQTKES